MRNFFLLALLLLSSCIREAWHAPLSLPADTTVLTSLPPAGKYKFSGPVNITLQKGNNNVANPVATGKTKADAAAIGPAASAAATTASTPWWVFGLLLAGGAALGFWGRGKLSGRLLF